MPWHGFDHYPGHRPSREIDGPHSGPYAKAAICRVRCADRASLHPGVLVKAEVLGP